MLFAKTVTSEYEKEMAFSRASTVTGKGGSDAICIDD